MALLVNNERIEDAEIREEERVIRPRLHEAMNGQDPAAVEARVRQWARENVIERAVLRQAAMADPNPVVAENAESEARARIDRLLSRATAHLSPPRNKDVVEYYRKHREELQAPERIHAAHIVKNVDGQNDETAARAVIEDIYRRLQEGAKFEKLADEASDCPGNGGDLGKFARGQMVDEFDAVVFALKPGQMSGVFRTTFGFHIAKVYERYPEGIPELAAIRPELEQMLFNQKKQRAIEQFLDRLIAKADVREA